MNAKPPRMDSVDLLRGAVMIFMALDHVRDHFTILEYGPTDLAKTYPLLFLTRWITHFCAPVFVFLAGAGSYLSRARGKTTGQSAWMLFSRGLFLVLLEVTVIEVAWQFNFEFRHGLGLRVIWAIGVSMIAMSVLV